MNPGTQLNVLLTVMVLGVLSHPAYVYFSEPEVIPVDTATVEITQEMYGDLATMLNECDIEAEVEEYLSNDNKISIDEASSLIAVCEYNLHETVDPFSSARRRYELKTKDGVQM